ncbi:hypothetical protein AB0I98_23555 [Streptomyces sp. NPDC050211]|uniref:hypothetical protein n=1 Tax=Streptomyces sp. NPDC050211 TaxID=3154932 RepID=UPI0034123567
MTEGAAETPTLWPRRAGARGRGWARTLTTGIPHPGHQEYATRRNKFRLHRPQACSRPRRPPRAPQPDRITELRSNVVAPYVTLDRDSEGPITRHADGTAVRDYTYDPAGQLVAAHLTRAGTTVATDAGYDIAGNRTMTVTDGHATRYLYGAADQLVAIESTGRRIRYTYDGAGRLTRADDGDGYLVRRQGRTGDDSAPHTEVCYQWTVGDSLPQILHQHIDTKVPQNSNTAPVGRDLATARFSYGTAIGPIPDERRRAEPAVPQGQGTPGLGRLGRRHHRAALKAEGNREQREFNQQQPPLPIPIPIPIPVSVPVPV